MEIHYKEILELQLTHEIERIGRHVATLENPTRTEERSVFARYGKLIFVSQQLLEVVRRRVWKEGAAQDTEVAEASVSVTVRKTSSFSRQLGVR